MKFRICPFPSCPEYGQQGCGYVVQKGRDQNGRVRYRCTLTGTTFGARAGTPFHRLRTNEATVTRAMALIKDGMSLRKAAGTVGVRPNTLVEWRKKFQSDNT